ncbi:SDR family NAD(P)-dependent oxidoreductase [Lutimonas zeaxanthinifaciens]|uniref:SDR family NAD(P)-dependent oxidoreductase n=1 Tax=Lutimonas zeaxanthinifaciens TaxID=3060215 RepID=UPI00265CF677|nr:SDR family NAD(P)-dependent oxidoreductase [Lutimonas sp. YSD2104]WKK65222.1 SDR family NAD(P)-dependent oxidoreductase [Lutimonas sp. YSD2104]
MDKNLPLASKIIWITGASSGIGEALSYEFAKRGALLILSSRSEQKLLTVKENLPLNSDKAKVLALDLEQLNELKNKVETALSYFGKIDFFVSNAGLAVKDFVINTPLEIDLKLMNINYFSSILITKSLLPHFMQRNTGHIVVTSSLSGKYGVPKIASYAASKHALHGFYETLRSEITDYNIDLTIVIPGIIKTEITAHALTGTGDKFGKIDKTFQTAYPADKAATKIVNAVMKKKESVFIGGSEGITLFLNRLSPWLFRRFIRNHPIKKMRQFKRTIGLK